MSEQNTIYATKSKRFAILMRMIKTSARPGQVNEPEQRAKVTRNTTLTAARSNPLLSVFETLRREPGNILLSQRADGSLDGRSCAGSKCGPCPQVGWRGSFISQVEKNFNNGLGKINSGEWRLRLSPLAVCYLWHRRCNTTYTSLCSHGIQDCGYLCC